MKKFKKILAFVMSLTVSCSVFASCGGGGEDPSQKEQADKTNIYVANFDGGYGNEWLKKAIERFENENKEKVYEERKKGVHVIIDDSLDKEQVKGVNLIDIIADNRADVFFTEKVYYHEFVKQGLIADITDVVQSTNTDGKTIENKLTEVQKEYYNYQGKYYVLPHYAAFSGIMYDVDLFEENKLYFGADKDSCDEQGFIVNMRATKANGPDGVSGTADDGLPATYSDFFKLCMRMIDKGITPIIWNGEYKDSYTQELIAALQVDYEGLEQSMLNYTYSGTATNIVDSIDGEGIDATIQTKNVEITADNAYELMQQAGKYYSLSFFEKVMTTTYVGKKLYSNKSLNTSYSHTDAQDEFLLSRPEGNPIGMIFEGIWWENEAANSNTFEDCAGQFGGQYARNSRKLAVMPYPKANTSKLGKTTLLDNKYSAGFINANIKDDATLNAAKDFLKFCYTDTSLVEFNTTTNLTTQNQSHLIFAFLGKRLAVKCLCLLRHIFGGNLTLRIHVVW